MSEKLKRADEEKHCRWHSYGSSQQTWNNVRISLKIKTWDVGSRMRSRWVKNDGRWVKGVSEYI